MNTFNVDLQSQSHTDVAGTRVINSDVNASRQEPTHPGVRNTASDTNTGNEPLGSTEKPRSPVEVSEERPASEFVDGTHVCNGKTLNYKMFKPFLVDGPVAPLVVMLHGCTQNAQDFAAGTRMNALAEEHGLFVLYPSQPVTANPNLCWNWYESAHQQHGSGEPALLCALIREVLANHPVDPDRIFIAGFCAGGAMALIMAEQYQDLFAAVGVHSGIPTGAASSMPEALVTMLGFSGNSSDSPSGEDPLNGLASELPFRHLSQIDGPRHGQRHESGSTIPLIVFHGERDLTVSCSNGDRIVSDWLASGKAATESNTWIPNIRQHSTSMGRRSTVTVYSNQRNSEHIGCEHWKLSCDHAWSGGDGAFSYTDAGGLDASAEMIRFFSDTTLS